MIESGEMRYTYRDFVLDGHRPYAQWAAEAARCAEEQGKFWAYRAILFSNQKKWAKSDFKLYAEKLDLDTQQFNQCFDSGKYTEAVNQSTKEAANMQLKGTPTFLINGREIDLNQYNTVQSFMAKLKEEIGKAR